MNNHKLEVYDPAMCCSTGVCGPSVDSKLVQFAADLKWLQEQGVEVQRFNLGQNPTAFVDNELVNAALAEKNEAALPLLLVDGRVVSSGRYAERAELAAWLGVAVPPNSTCCGGGDAELQTQSASTCGADCGCHAPTSSGKMRMAIGVIMLLAAGTLVVRAITKSNETAPKTPEPSFTIPAALQPAATPEEKAPVPETTVGTVIGAFSELNLLAAKTDAVFIFLPSKDTTSGNLPSTVMKSAVTKIEGQGLKCGLFTMKAGSPDYDKIAAQMATPGVLAMVKGRGMSAISGEITEEKLLQGYVAASRSGGCGPAAGGCGPAGCK